MRLPLTLIAALVAALALAGLAAAGGGNYVVVGATPEQDATIRAALEASRFDWSQVPPVTIRVVPGLVNVAESIPGEIRLRPDRLAFDRLAWGVVQHEYGHQVDYHLLDDEKRGETLRFFGMTSWRSSVRQESGVEVFASSVACTFWRNVDNASCPEATRDWRGFQRLLHGWGLAPAPLPVCMKVRVRKGHWVKVRGNRRWSPPVYRKVCR